MKIGKDVLRVFYSYESTTKANTLISSLVPVPPKSFHTSETLPSISYPICLQINYNILISGLA